MYGGVALLPTPTSDAKNIALLSIISPLTFRIIWPSEPGVVFSVIVKLVELISPIVNTTLCKSGVDTVDIFIFIVYTVLFDNFTLLNPVIVT